MCIDTISKYLIPGRYTFSKINLISFPLLQASYEVLYAGYMLQSKPSDTIASNNAANVTLAIETHKYGMMAGIVSVTCSTSNFV